MDSEPGVCFTCFPSSKSDPETTTSRVVKWRQVVWGCFFQNKGGWIWPWKTGFEECTWELDKPKEFSSHQGFDQDGDSTRKHGCTLCDDLAFGSFGLGISIENPEFGHLGMKLTIDWNPKYGDDHIAQVLSPTLSTGCSIAKTMQKICFQTTFVGFQVKFKGCVSKYQAIVVTFWVRQFHWNDLYAVCSNSAT